MRYLYRLYRFFGIVWRLENESVPRKYTFRWSIEQAWGLAGIMANIRFKQEGK